MAEGRADGSGLPLVLRTCLQLPERTWGLRPMPTARERPGARRSAFACGLRVRARLKLLGTPPDFVWQVAESLTLEKLKVAASTFQRFIFGKGLLASHLGEAVEELLAALGFPDTLASFYQPAFELVRVGLGASRQAAAEVEQLVSCRPPPTPSPWTSSKT